MNSRGYVWLLAGHFLCLALSGVVHGQTLEAFAQLPADTFSTGPTSGQFIEPANGRVPPFVGKQPVQGFSAILRAPNGDFLVMPDNGFGAKNNSADFVLRVYRISVDFKDRNHGAGTIQVKSFISLRDPDHRVNFPIVADAVSYPGSTLPVDEGIRKNRWLTGADFDIESFREARDGTLWFGDEFGPFLIHTDASGRVIDPPYPLPGVKSPDNPLLGSEAPNLPSSKGFEGMAISPDGRTLYPMLEGPLITEADQRVLIINQFDIDNRRYTGKRWLYRMEAEASAGQSIGDLTAVTGRTFLVIERDSLEGSEAVFKKVFLVDFDQVDGEGFLVKHEVVDLLQLRDPYNIAGFGPVFRFPFQTIESIVVLGADSIGVLNDNNYPFSSGRTMQQPDPNEFIIIRLDRPLAEVGKLSSSGQDRQPSQAPERVR